MMKKTSCFSTTLLCGLLLSCFLLAGCGSQQLDKVDIEMKEISTEITADNGVVLMEISSTYPVLSAEKESTVLTKLNQQFQQTAEDYVQAAANDTQVITGAAQMYQENPENFVPYYFHHTAEVTYNQKGIFSLIWNNSFYTGGAHPNLNSLAENYDLNTGELLSLGDLLDMDNDKAYELVEQRYQGVIQTNSEDFFPDAAQYLTEHLPSIQFYMAPEGPTVFFQVYEVAPYAAGRVDIIIGGDN